ncbi:TonB-dependent receptor plug domain protein [Bordetella bronchiseptica 980-2]|nr:TonB-dependent receptor plug domain protein [Bordetella bronchiseptica 980-2]KCV38195.1 TonB-dependent receptor plug domain protein [Bordetella bronchiseptica 00-P-2796]KCV50555.1 TonB-dependent receptor plug domain protein [Bordetella bronchiseptica 3E44]KCV55104.1 TonB-dependent receptor plug domain protein [Bordetella bronchiseptica 980]KDB61915.1 TonB-dependent receptor plug domain protein [Bordetella bronchiseptica B18-5 (C3)]KDB68016.1 TonB-dependent receptor plug domain protein [Bord
MSFLANRYRGSRAVFPSIPMSEQKSNQRSGGAQHSTHASRRRPILRHAPLALAIAALGAAQAQTASPQEDTLGITQMDTVVVTASGFEQEIKNAPASISVITREQLESKPFHNLADAVADVEGVSVERGGKAGGMNISIRGLPSDYTLVLVDGKRLSQNSSGARPNGFGDVDTNFIPPMSAIDRIEVVRGPMSTLYGSDAMGGVINIITRKVAREWTGQVTLDGTAQGDNRYGNNYGSSFYLSGPLQTDKLGLSLRGGLYRRLSAHGSYPANQAEYDSGDYSGDIASFSGLGDSLQRNVGLRLALTPNRNHDILFDVDANWQTFDNANGELGTLNADVAPNRQGGGYEPEMKFNRQRYALTHLGRYDGAISSDTSLLYDTTETIGRTNPMSTPRQPSDGEKRELEYENWVFDTKWTMPLFNDRHNLTMGGQWREQKFKDTLVSAPLNLRQYQWALFAEDEWRIVDDLALTMGARYDRNEQFGGKWSPRGYLVWNATPAWTVKGGVSKGYKTPDINLMTDGIIGLGAQGTMPLLGNSQLKPESSTSSELGVLFDDGEGLTGNLTGFHTKFKDKIDTQNVPNCLAAGGPVPGCLDLGVWERNGVPVANFSQRVNVDTATIQGFELGGRIPLFEGWSFSGNYTLTASEITSGAKQGQPLGSQPRHSLNLGLNWRVNERFNAWVRGEYRAKQFNDMNWEKEQVFYSPYWLASLGGSYVLNKNVTLSASVYNLFDKNFVDYGPTKVGTSAPTAATSWSNSYRQVLEGRRLWVSANITF